MLLSSECETIKELQLEMTLPMLHHQLTIQILNRSTEGTKARSVNRTQIRVPRTSCLSRVVGLQYRQDVILAREETNGFED